MRFTHLSVASALLAFAAGPAFALPLRSADMTSSTPMRRDASSRSQPAVAWLEKRTPGSGVNAPPPQPVEAIEHVYTPHVPDAVGGFTSGETVPEIDLSGYKQAVENGDLSEKAFAAIEKMLTEGR